MKYELSFFSEYGQFYITDRNNCGNTGSKDFWSNEAFEQRLAVEIGIIGIRVENDEAIVNSEIEVIDCENINFEIDSFDHIAEASLKIESGYLQITECPSQQVELEVKLEPGEYRVRVYSKNLDLAYSSEPKDFYKIEVWKDKYSERKVIKNK